MAIGKWLSGIADNEKDSWLVRFLSGDDPGLRRECLVRYHQSSAPAIRGTTSARSVGELHSIADDLERQRLEKERQDAARKERSRIMALAGQETGLWQAVTKLSDSSSSRYQDNAIGTLKDLRELASLNGVSTEFQEKLEGLIELRRRKSAFMKKMQEAGLA